MAGNTLNIYTDLHTASLSAVDAAVGRFRRDDEVRADLIFVDDVLPAEAVTVLFLDGAGDEDRIGVGQ